MLGQWSPHGRELVSFQNSRHRTTFINLLLCPSCMDQLHSFRVNSPDEVLPLLFRNSHYHGFCDSSLRWFVTSTCIVVPRGFPSSLIQHGASSLDSSCRKIAPSGYSRQAQAMRGVSTVRRKVFGNLFRDEQGAECLSYSGWAEATCTSQPSSIGTVGIS